MTAASQARRNHHPLYQCAHYRSEGPFDTLRSAEKIVPLVLSIVPARSVVDVGCGSGAWLAVFQEHGIESILGIDGAHVDPGWLRIPPERFRALDLREPFQIQESFDLAVCLEVSEHLPPESAPALVRSLVALAPVILFSAAVPQQGGIGHVNEQWPSYWRELFEKERFRMLDVVRKEIWMDREIKFWYRQNLYLVVREDVVQSRTTYSEAAGYADDLLLIHASILERQLSFRCFFRNLPRIIGRAASHVRNRIVSAA